MSTICVRINIHITHRRQTQKEKKLKCKRLKYCDVEVQLAEDELAEFDAPFIVEGFVGKPKGSRVHTFLRGHWRNGMTHYECCRVLNAQPDFKMEKSRLEKRWIKKVMDLPRQRSPLPSVLSSSMTGAKASTNFEII